MRVVNGKLADDEGIVQQVKIAPDRGMGDSEGAAEFSTVPDLAVIMGEHGPETT